MKKLIEVGDTIDLDVDCHCGHQLNMPMLIEEMGYKRGKGGYLCAVAASDSGCPSCGRLLDRITIWLEREAAWT